MTNETGRTLQPAKMLLKFAYDFAVERFKKNKFDNPDLEARWLVSGVLKVPETAIYSDSSRKLEQDEIMLISKALEERMGGKPLAYILGQKDFYGRTFEVTPATLIPRPETELIVDLVAKVSSKTQPLMICDMGTGSGCLGLSLLAELPKSQLVTIDISPLAIEVAKRNAERLGVSDRVEMLFGAVSMNYFKEQQFDIVVANPPYISEEDPEVDSHVRKYEPHTALFAGEDGYKLIFDWLKVTMAILKPKGFFVFEIGRNQADRCLNFVDNLKSFSEVRVIKDLSGNDRILIGRRL